MASSATWPIKSSSLMPYFLTNSSACCLVIPSLTSSPRYLRLGLLHAQLGIDRVELDQRLTRLDSVADVVMDLDDPAAPFGPDRHLLPAPQTCR